MASKIYTPKKEKKRVEKESRKREKVKENKSEIRDIYRREKKEKESYLWQTDRQTACLPVTAESDSRVRGTKKGYVVTCFDH